MSKFSIRKIVAAAAFAAAALTPVASHAAAQLNSYLINGRNTLEDTNFDRILRCTDPLGCTTLAQMTVITTGDFRQGDVLEAALRFEQANSTQLGNLVNYQLTAYSAIAVGAVTSTNVPLDPINFPGVFIPVNVLTFVPTAVVGIDSGLGAAGMARVYESANENFDVTATPAQLLTNIKSGTEVMTLGLGAAEDDYWFATVGRGLAGGGTQGNIDQLTTLTSSSAILGTGQFGLSVLSNPGLVNVIPEQMDGALGGKHDTVGQVAGFQLQDGANTEWLISTDTKVRFVRIPEPAGLALVGLAVAIAGFAGVRRSKA